MKLDRKALRRRRTLAAATSLGGVFGIAMFAGHAAAQTAAPPQAEAAPPAQASSTTLGEVIVTAQKRSESLVNVPIAVTAVSGSNLNKAGVTDMSDLAAVVPGIHIDSSGAFFQPSIRGVGTAIAGAGASANVATYVDGVYKPNALSNDLDFIDIDSVQVLKGPQGTLFGRNSTGGAILVTTRAPSFTPQLDVRVGYGSFNTATGEMFASDRITDTLAASISFGGSHSDGWITNTYNNTRANPSDDYSGRVKLLYEPNQKMKFTLTLDGFRTNDPTLYAVSAYKGWSNAALFGVPVSSGSPTKVSLDGPIAHIAEGGGAELKGEMDLGFATLTSYSSGQWQNGREATNEMAAPFPTNGSLPTAGLVDTITNADWLYHERTFTQEFDLSHNGQGPLDWVTGLFYYYDTTTYNPFNLGLYGPFGPGGELTGGTYPFPSSAYVSTGDLAFSGFTLPTASAAVFGDVTYNWNNWHFTIGGRYSFDHIGEQYTSYPSIPDNFLNIPRISADHDFYSFTPRAVVRYNISHNQNVYLSYSEGTKAGLYNSSGFLLQQQPLAPERLRDIEAGYKVNGGSWRFEASAFHYSYTNLQVSTYIGGQAFLQNAPSAEIWGGDAHWQQRLTEHLDIDLGAAYTHARYTNFTNAAVQTFSPIYGVENSTANVSGGVMERTPEFTATAAIDYHTPLFGGVLDLNANANYQTASSFDFANTLRQSGYGLLNLRAAWTDPSKRWTVSVNGRNVTNTVYLTQVLPNAGGFGASYGEPVNVMGQIEFKY